VNPYQHPVRMRRSKWHPHLHCISSARILASQLDFQSNDATQTFPACAFHSQSEKQFQRAKIGKKRHSDFQFQELCMV
jgi:hypothetical protein